MARKVKGYVELYWKCPSCGSENLGSHAYCTACGSPQPKTIDFHQGSKQQLITDPERLKKAKAGADIHCGFCGTRNPAGASHCAQCGSDLKQGLLRAGGKVTGAFAEGAAEPVKCENCGTLNAGTRLKCGNCGTSLAHGVALKAPAVAQAAKPVPRNTFLIGAGVILLLCAAVYFLFIRTQSVVAAVSGVNWTRSVAIEAFIPVDAEAWLDDLPTGAWDVSCSERVRTSQSEPPISGQRYAEVCGTPYNVDTGGGFAEVVQDCEYQIYDDYCAYTIEAWAPVSTVEENGFSLNAVWPSPLLSSDQRLGAEVADYECIFNASGRTYTYQTESFSEFQRCVIGSTWSLEINSLGAVTGISPAN